MSGPQAIIAVNTLNFVGSSGINTHLGYIGSSYSGLSLVESALEYFARGGSGHLASRRFTRKGSHGK